MDEKIPVSYLKFARNVTMPGQVSGNITAVRGENGVSIFYHPNGCCEVQKAGKTRVYAAGTWAEADLETGPVETKSKK